MGQGKKTTWIGRCGSAGSLPDQAACAGPAETLGRCTVWEHFPFRYHHSQSSSSDEIFAQVLQRSGHPLGQHYVETYYPNCLPSNKALGSFWWKVVLKSLPIYKEHAICAPSCGNSTFFGTDNGLTKGFRMHTLSSLLLQ